MRNDLSRVAAAALPLLASAAVAKPNGAAIRETDAATLADATVAAWMSMDAARIKALYAPGVVGFDMVPPALSIDRATWDSRQDAYAAAKFDRAVQKDRSIQILDADVFVVSGAWYIASSAVPANAMTVRCTDVY